ncbi:electron transfer flavoprotein subunit beta/FixA family protein [bacterium]|nr:electron transfer flavoprotein subunit beta/FixA family protein [bacterium]MBU1063948.1 electron transfer flavoprotein subunit beta/FixA family protein [bacterium]MBU1873998.1 electron transfer flavoprotein subunit beta/FixA family protein [bacterium]
MKKIVVLAKQVPDTANVTGDAMKADGTVNRAALPAIFNPEDLNALEMALMIKDKIGGEVIVISMGPPKAVEILKHSLYMGADRVMLITDRKFAAADTLATSYVLAEAIKNIGNVDLVLAGRQAIDGDTAQVGPQVADKIGYNQVTYVSKLKEFTDDYLIVERDGEVQTEVIKTAYPVLLTVTAEANTPRYPNCRKMLQYFRVDLKDNFSEDELSVAKENDWIIPTCTIDDLGLEEDRCGLKGSPTKVHKIKSIMLKGGDLKMYGTEATDIRQLVRDIMKDYVEVN